MSPIQVSIERRRPDGITHEVTLHRKQSFSVGPNLACDILNIPRTSLFRKGDEDPDVTRIPSKHGAPGTKERRYPDDALLRIAQQIPSKVDITLEISTGNTVLSHNNPGCVIGVIKVRTVLDIPFSGDK